MQELDHAEPVCSAVSHKDLLACCNGVYRICPAVRSVAVNSAIYLGLSVMRPSYAEHLSTSTNGGTTYFHTPSK